jgi:hypothetical protein
MSKRHDRNEASGHSSVPLKNLRSKRSLGLVGALLLIAGTTATCLGEDAEIYAPGTHPYGKSYGQWATAWWQWALSVPAANNPVLDSTGANAGVGQQGPVWFLGSTFGGPEERTLTIPNGKGIFLPVYQWGFGSSLGDCDPSNPGVVCNVDDLRASAAAATTSVQSMRVTVDGDPIEHLRGYRAVSPNAFKVVLPAGNVPQSFRLNTPAGTYFPQVADGYWLMLAPLEPGRHNIRVHVVPDAAYGTPFDVVYHITVRGHE